MARSINSSSIISLVFGIMSIFIPIGGVIFGIVGIVFSRKAIKTIAETNGDGRGLAVSGLICSIIGIIIQIFVIMGYVAYFSVDTRL